MTSLVAAFRSLRRSPGYVVVAVITLALGIGVNASMFSLIDAVMFRTAPFPHPEQLVRILAATRNGDLREFAEAEVREVHSQTLPLKALTTLWPTFYSVAERGRPAERFGAVAASADLFDTFGIHPVLGRPFTAEETKQGKNQVVLLSYRFWQQRYDGRPDVLGRTLRLDGQAVTIIGVMPPSCDDPALWGDASLWRPLNYTHDQLTSRDYKAFDLVGRLAPGATSDQVAAALGSLASDQARKFPQRYAGLHYRVLPLREAMTDARTRRMYWMLLGLAGFVLLIACANLANLQLVRATSGLRDLAIRAALGATRARLIAQQLVECTVVALGGGVVGIAVAAALNRFLANNLFAASGANLSLALSAPVLALTTALSLAAGVAFGIVPAWLASRVDLNSSLKQGSRGSTVGRGHHRVRNALVVAQVALALVLLAGAGFMERGFSRLLERRTGWDTDAILTAGLPIPESRFESEPSRYALFHKIEQRLAAMPGVEDAAVCSSLPLESYTGERPIYVDGQTPSPNVQAPRATHVMVTSGYFRTLGIPFLEGRNFPPDLKRSAPLTIIVNEALARRFWPGQSALGHKITSDDSGYITTAEIVGVVRDVDMAASLSKPTTRLQIYKPLVDEPWAWANLVVRGHAPASLADEMRRAVADVDPDLAVDQIQTVPQFIDAQHGNLLLVGEVLRGFAVFGLILAAVGLYSVISHTVVQRTGEFGIRLALGARPADVLALVLRHGLRLVTVGLVLGLLGAGVLGRFLGALLPRLDGVDVGSLAGVSIVLVATTLIACWVPARRATRVDPNATLRSE